MKRRIIFFISISFILITVLLINFIDKNNLLRTLNCIDFETTNNLTLSYNQNNKIIQSEIEKKCLNNLLKEVLSNTEDFSKLEREIRDLYIIEFSDPSGSYNLTISFSNSNSNIVIHLIQQNRNKSRTFCYICDEDLCKYTKNTLKSIIENR